MADNLEVKFKISEDGADNVKKKIAGIGDGAKGSQKEVDSLSTKLKNLSTALAGLAVLRTIGSLFGRASEEATKLEKSFLRLESSARAFGQSGEQAKKAAQDLSKNGFATLEQNATAISNLFATGLNVDQSRKFVAAAQDIAAFGNTTGDAAQSVVDLTKGILTNSAEVIENASPALKEINSQYQQNVKDVGKAAAVQQLYTDVLQLSTKFTGDAEKLTKTYDGTLKQLDATTSELTAAIGKQVQEAFRPLLDVLLQVVKAFSEWFMGLSAASQQAIIFGSALIAIIPSVVSVISSLKALGITVGMLGGAFKLLLGPVGLVILALGALTAGYVAYNEVKARQERQARESKELAELTRLSTALKKNADERKRLAELENKYPNETNFLKALKNENLGIVRNLNLLEQYRNLQQNIAANPQSEEARRAAAITRNAQQQGAAPNRAIIQNLEQQATQLQGTLQALDQSRSANAFDTALVQQIDADARRIEARLQRIEFEANVRRSVQFSPTVEAGFQTVGGGGGGVSRQAMDIDQLRLKYAEYIEETREALLLRAKIDYKAQLDNLKNLAIEENLTAEQTIRKKKKLDEQYRKEKIKADVQAAANTLEAADRITRSSFGAVSSLRNGDVFGAIGGAGSAIGGPVGSAISSIAGIGSSIVSLFDSTQASEEVTRKMQEEQIALLREQANYQKALLEIERGREQLIGREGERRLRIADITATQRQIELTQQLNSGTITRSQFETQLQTIQREQTSSRVSALGQTVTELSAATGINATSPQEVISRISSIDKRILADKAVIAAMGVAVNNPNWYIDGIRQQVLSGLDSARGFLSDASPETVSQFNTLYDSIIASRYNDANVQFGNNASFQVENERNRAAQSRVINIRNTLGSFSESIIGGSERQLESASDLASILQQYQEEQLAYQMQIAENTEKTAINTESLSFRNSRSTGILDIGSRIINAAGQAFISPDVQNAIQNVRTPATVQSIQLATAAADNFQARIANGVSDLVGLAKEANILLAAIAAALDNDASTNPLDARSQISRLLSSAKKAGLNI